MELIINKQENIKINIKSAREIEDQIKFNANKKLICLLSENNTYTLDNEIKNFLKNFLDNGINIIEIFNNKNELIFSSNNYSKYAGFTKNISDSNAESIITFE